MRSGTHCRALDTPAAAVAASTTCTPSGRSSMAMARRIVGLSSMMSTVRSEEGGEDGPIHFGNGLWFERLTRVIADRADRGPRFLSRARWGRHASVPHEPAAPPRAPCRVPRLSAGRRA